MTRVTLYIISVFGIAINIKWIYDSRDTEETLDFTFSLLNFPVKSPW